MKKETHMRSKLLHWSFAVLLGSNFLTSCYFQKNPEITGQAVEEPCGARITYVDHAPDPSIVFLRRSSDGTHYADIKAAKQNGEADATFVDEGILPMGTYYYVVGFFNPNEVRYSEVSDPLVITDESCGTGPLVNKPINPILTHVIVENNCDVVIWGVVKAEEYDGYRIYRRSLEKNETIIADLTAQEFNATVGDFHDLGLPPGVYQYRVSVYNGQGESFSDLSEEVAISPEACPIPFAPPVGDHPLAPISTLTVSTSLPSLMVVSPTATSVPKLQACTWEALINVFLRKGPDIELFDKAAVVEKGTQLPVIGQSEFGNFWILEFQPGSQGYVSKSERVGKVTGDCASMPALKDPAPPVKAPVATKTQKDSSGGAATPECSDGIDNDNDGWADMRDLAGCTSPTDPVED
jgi:hypothetical protein